MIEQSEPNRQPPPQAPAHDFRRTESLCGKASTKNIKALIESMSAIGWIGEPIIVIEIVFEKYILNGHHRVFAAREAKISVPYRVISEENLLNYGYDSTDQVITAHAETTSNRIRLG